jgi:hypothetical protein
LRFVKGSDIGIECIELFIDCFSDIVIHGCIFCIKHVIFYSCILLQSIAIFQQFFDQLITIGSFSLPVIRVDHSNLNLKCMINPAMVNEERKNLYCVGCITKKFSITGMHVAMGNLKITDSINSRNSVSHKVFEVGLMLPVE